MRDLGIPLVSVNTDKVEVEEYIESAGRSEFIDRYLLKPAR